MATKPTTSRTASAAKARGAKSPSDRQTASTEAQDTVHEFNYRGAVYEIDADVLDDAEVIETMQQSLSMGLRRMLGSEQYKELTDQLREEDPKGIVRVSKLREFFEELGEAIRPLG